MTPKAYHIVPDNRAGGWDVRSEEEPEIHRHFATRDEALEYGRKASLEDGVDLVVHDQLDDTAWILKRRTTGSVEMVIEENKSLPEDLRKMLAQDPNTRFIRRGPIQPKGRSAPRKR